MWSVDIGRQLISAFVWDQPDKPVLPTGSLRSLTRASDGTLRTVRLNNRFKGMAGLVIALAFALVPYRAGAAASSNCAAGKTMCGTRCVNLSVAPKNCGACGNVCAAGKTCAAGVCN